MRKKQRGRGSQRPVESELTSAQIPRASLSPHREVSPVLFSQPDQRPSASVSDLVSFGGSDDELADDSMSASDAEELSGSVTDPAPSRLHLHLHLVIWQTLLSKATYNWGIHKAIHLEEAIRQRKCS